MATRSDVIRVCGRASLLAMAVWCNACTGGGGGRQAGAGGALQPFAIDAAASPAVAADVRDLLERGDRYAFEPDVALANALYDSIWQQLLSATEWLEPADNTSFQFFDDSDPITAWGRAYRYAGNGTFAGPVVPFTAGTYTRANGARLPAVTVQTWDSSHAELLVLLDGDTVVHALQNNNGLPIVEVLERR
jgi:hypothetical protein